jgi:hypothetical protein
MKDIIGVDHIRIGDAWYTDADLIALPIEKLEDIKLKVNSLVIDISSKIQDQLATNPALSAKVSQSKARWSAGDQAVKVDAEAAEDHDLVWYVNAKYALNLFQRALPYVSSILRRRRSSERPFSSWFMDVARDTLPERTFEEISEEARYRQKVNRKE